MVHRLEYKAKTIKLLGENIEKNLSGLELGKDVLNMIQNPQTT